MRPIPSGALVWDKDKALSNKHKLGIKFEEAGDVFLDPLAVICPDPGNGRREDRWTAVGVLKNGILAVVAHTFEERADGARVRIISARRATKHERSEYETGKCPVREPMMTHEYDTDADEDDGMEVEYDFSNGVRGKHYLHNAVISFPIYLDTHVLEHFSGVARSRDLETCELLNEILRPQMPGGRASDYPGTVANVRFPIFIDNRTLGYFHGRAIATGIPGEELINEVLRQYVKAAGYVAPGFSTEPR